MTDYLAGHTQLGLKSNIITDFNSKLSLDAGVHVQMYNTWEEERITDLLGADYWYEDYDKQSLMGLSGRNPIKHIGDKVRTENGRNQFYATLYALITYTAGHTKPTILTLGASASGTTIRRWDLYNYTADNRFSNWATKAGASLKFGALHKLNRHASIYANAAAYSRAPYSNVFFSSRNNSISKDIVNEKNILAEGGFRILGNRFSLEATAYSAFWKDKSLMSAAYKTVDEDPTKYMIKGLNALHYGVEADASYTILRSIKAGAFLSIGQWKWMNDVIATIYDPYSMKPVQEITVYAKGLHVGDAPQTQIGATIDAKIFKGLSAHLEWNYNDRFWSDFNPASRTSADDRQDSFRLPSYNLLNIGLAWAFNIKHLSGSLFLNATNITDTSYIERSKDGPSHDINSLTGYWGNGRSFNFGIRLHIR